MGLVLLALKCLSMLGNRQDQSRSSKADIGAEEDGVTLPPTSRIRATQVANEKWYFRALSKDLNGGQCETLASFQAGAGNHE